MCTKRHLQSNIGNSNHRMSWSAISKENNGFVATVNFRIDYLASFINFGF